MLRASTQAEPVVVPRVNVKTNGHYQLVQLTVEQLREPEELRGLLLVTFEDLSAAKKTAPGRKSAVPSTEKDKVIEQMEQLLDALPEPAVLLNGSLGVVVANGAFLRAFGREDGQVRDRPFYTQGNGAWDAAALRGWLEAVLAGNASESFPAAVPGALPHGKPVQLKARRLRNGEGEAPQLLVTLE